MWDLPFLKTSQDSHRGHMYRPFSQGQKSAHYFIKLMKGILHHHKHPISLSIYIYIEHYSPLATLGGARFPPSTVGPVGLFRGVPHTVA